MAHFFFPRRQNAMLGRQGAERGAFVRRFKLLAAGAVLCSSLAIRNGQPAAPSPLSPPQWPEFGFDGSNAGRSPYIGPRTSRLRWRAPIPDWGSGIAVGADGTAYVGVKNVGVLLALDGKEREKRRFALPPIEVSPPYELSEAEKREWENMDPTASIVDATVAPDGTVYFGEALRLWQFLLGQESLVSAYERNLYALNSDGSVKWRFSIGEENLATHITFGSNDDVFFGTTKGKLRKAECRFYAVSPGGEEMWSVLLTTSGSLLSPAIGPDGTLYVGGNKLRALDPDDGSIKWERDVQSAASPPRRRRARTEPFTSPHRRGRKGTAINCTP